MAVGMKAWAGGCLLVAGLLLVGCTETRDSGGPDGAGPSDGSAQSPGQRASPGGRRAQDLRSLQVRDATGDLTLGQPPRIAWSEPAPPGRSARRIFHPAVDAASQPEAVAVLRRPVRPRESNCWSLVPRGGTTATWTRCYRWGGRPADGLGSPALSPDARWAVDLLFTGETVLLDARTGRALARVVHGGRAQAVAFEDPTHYLVVVTDEDSAEAFPGQWIVRCEVAGTCERAIETVQVESYDQLGFPRSGRAG